MNLVQGAIFLAVASGATYYFAKPAPADEYALPLATVYEKLAAVSVPYNPNGNDRAALGGRSLIPGGNGTDRVIWTIGYSSPVECVLGLTPLAASKTKVAISCNQPERMLAVMQAAKQGADLDFSKMSGPHIDEVRNDAIEKLDSTLTNRPFDAKSYLSWRWPADVVHHANMAEAGGQMYSNAIKASVADARRQRQQMIEQQNHGGGSDSTPAAFATPTSSPKDSGNPWAH